jgi:TonB-linked SusC/RagA family outer membrane protein
MTELIIKTRKTQGRKINCRWVLLMFAFMLTALSAYSQNLTVKGTVKDSQTGEALIGVNIVIKGTVTGVMTDINGQFSLNNCPPTAVLTFSYISYTSLDVEVQGRSSIDARLVSTLSQLDEVVVIGYGTAKKKDITGSVSSVQGKDIARIPVSTAAEALTGRMAGVQIVATEGSPDAAIKIRVRGGGSITQDNTPLYIVDGFPVSSISDIPGSTIQSIDVLKDASSTAIYGARGANGVIIVTTKGGSEGKIRVNYNAYYGFKKVANHLNSLSVEDYVKWQYEYALLSDNLSNYEKFFGLYQDIDLFAGQPSTNWYDQVFGRQGNTFSQDLNITGGTEKLKYAFGFAGLNSKEIMLGSEYKRNNFSLKLDNKPVENVGLSFTIRYSDTKIFGAGATDQTNATPNDARVKQSMIFSPIPFTAMGNFEDEEVSSSMVNPLSAVNDNDRQQQKTRFNLGGSFSWEIVDGLELRTEAGLDRYLTNDDRFYGLTTYYVKNTPSAAYQNMPALESNEFKSLSLRSTNTLNFDFNKIINNEAHSLKVLLGQELIVTQSNNMFNQIWGFPTFFNADQAYNLVSQGFSNNYTNVYNPDDKLLSFFGRANYDFKKRYLISATFRADGSSLFSKDNQWGYFPSAAIAWRISEEQFMKDLSTPIDNMKIRFSYGTAGNNNIPANQISQIFTAGTSSWIDGFTSFWSPSTTMANPDLKWETTYTRNLGLDFGLFKSLISGSVELYFNTTKDLLINFPVSGSGYNTQYRNMGETRNKGLEIALNGVLIDKEKYGLNIGFNIGFNRNKIVSLGMMNDFGQASGWASTEIGNDYWIAKGGSVGQMSGYKSDGRYEVSDFSGYNNGTWTLNEGVADDKAIIGTVRPGSMKLKDLDGDGVVNGNDISVIGNANPKHTGGFNIDARAYGFDMSAVFSWSYGNDIYNANKVEYTTGRYQFRNMIDIMADGKRWTNLDPATGEIVNDPETLASMNENTTMWSPYMTRHVFSDWAVEDGSYLRLNTLSLGYSIPTAIVQKAHIQNLRLYVSASNVFILTKYTGFDPEVDSRRNTGLTPGLDYSAYPKSRQLLFGLNLTF